MMVLFGLNLVLFQFHKGTIRTELQVLNLVSLLHFNSIKVQLEPIKSVMTITCTDRFQFHKGTIRTVISITSFLFFANFNSIKVQLELYLHSYLRQSRQNFNSIKVQLEPKFNLFDKEVHSFQFHKGTIRTFITSKYFNFANISIS